MPKGFRVRGRLIIAGERSGVGKTTITLALLAALQRRGLTVQSFKVGPDYIDPMFHRRLTGRPCRNLDPVLTSEPYVQTCFHSHTQTVDCAIVEGVMGLFDGRGTPHQEPSQQPFSGWFASTAHIAQLLNLPIALVLDCSRLSASVAAIVHGYRTLNPNLTLAGVILNRVGSDRHRQFLVDALQDLGERTAWPIPILGIVHRQSDITIPDRHLGLVPVGELEAFQDYLERLADLGDRCFDWDKILGLLMDQKFKIQNSKFIPDQPQPITQYPPLIGNDQPLIPHSQQPISQPPRPKIKIAIAYDRAFNFYYQDNLDQLVSLGAELLFWSPLQDGELPPGSQGLYLGGGFPEVFASGLSANQRARSVVKTAIQSGLPTYAECGGLMYLCEDILDFEGRSWPMVGLIPATAVMGGRLTLGYRRVQVLRETPLFPAGSIVWGHEFHRSTLRFTGAGSENWETVSPDLAVYQECSDPAICTAPLREGWQSHSVQASYLHLHWGDKPEIPQRFLSQCASFQYGALL